MNELLIGLPVHYREAGEFPACRAAVITDARQYQPDGFGFVALVIFHPQGIQYQSEVRHDPSGARGHTWHHVDLHPEASP